jgi:eukaryotic-like serine/threonine-protein kinase
LRSLELVPDSLGRMPEHCPACGGTIDSRRGSYDTPTSNFTVPIGNDPIAPGDHCWSETFAKGTLGTLGRFQLREVRGDGGFGVVYQAYDPRLDRDVALKVLKEKDPGERVMQRFFREARAAARLKHPNIVGVLDSGCDAGRCWIAYEFVNGRTLSRVAEAQPLGIVKSVTIARELAEAIEHAHSLGVYHRDLKPANVMIDANGHAHLIDFGLARRGDLDSDLTRDGAILGTPKYMAPEQANGESRTAGERSDIYSLGVILFEMLTGHRPVDAPSNAPIWNTKKTEIKPPPSLRQLNKDVPVALERVVLKALAVDPKDRYPSARAFREALKGWLDSRKRLTIVSATVLSALVSLAACVVLIVFLRPYLIRQLNSVERSDGSVVPELVVAPATLIEDGALDRPYVNAWNPILYHLKSGAKYHTNPKCGHLVKKQPEEIRMDELKLMKTGFIPSRDLCKDCPPEARADASAKP